MTTNNKSADQILEELFSSLGEYRASEELQHNDTSENKNVSPTVIKEDVTESKSSDRDHRKRKKKRKHSEDNEKKSKHKKSKKAKKKKSHRKKEKSVRRKSEEKTKKDASAEKQNERKMKEIENNMSKDRLDEQKMDENEKKKINEKNEVKKYKKEECRDKKEYDRNRSTEKTREVRKHERDYDSRYRDRSKYKESSRKKLSRSRSPVKFRSRSRSRSPVKFRSRSRSRSPVKFRSRSRSRSPVKLRKSRSRSRSRTPHIDKAQLLEFARKNLKRMQETGTISLPKGISEEKFRVLKSGGKTVEELTNYCKHLSRQGNSPDENEKTGGDSDPDDHGVEKPFTRHPFQIKVRSDPIVLNIRNGVPLPVRKPEERVAAQAQLKQQFPVSSGQQHLELEWVPVSPTKEEPNSKKDKVDVNDSGSPTVHASQPVPNLAAVAPMPRDNPCNVSADNIDIGLVIARRISAIKKLQENGQDIQAQLELEESDLLTRNWASAHYTNPVTGEPMREFIDWSIAPQVK